MTSEVRDLILSANSSFPYYDQGIPFVRGKVLVWDMVADKESDVESFLPSETLAKSPDENITIFAVVNPQGYSSYVYLVAIYWPEKIIAGFHIIYVDYSRDNATTREPAEWIIGLPISDALPAFTIINEVRGLILAANSSYQSPPDAPSPTLSGKVLVWNFVENNEADYVESILPSELVANSSEGKITVFAIVGVTWEIVGHYYPGGANAYQMYWDVLVLHCPEKEVVGRYTVVGLYPPSTATATSSASGDVSRPMAEWILSLPKE